MFSEKTDRETSELANKAQLEFFFFQAEDGIRDFHVTGVQTCALPISTVCRDRPAAATKALRRCHGVPRGNGLRREQSPPHRSISRAVDRSAVGRRVCRDGEIGRASWRERV